MNYSIRFASYTKDEWCTSGQRIKHGNTSLIWGTNLPTDRRPLISLYLSVFRTPVVMDVFYLKSQVTAPYSRIVRDGFTNMPRTAAEFADYFSKSPIGQLNREDMVRYEESYVNVPERARYYRDSVLAEHAKYTRRNSYVLFTASFHLC
jgi:hypothetical protein